MNVYGMVFKIIHLELTDFIHLQFVEKLAYQGKHEPWSFAQHTFRTEKVADKICSTIIIQVAKGVT